MNPPDDQKPLISDDGPINRRTALLQQRRLEETHAPSHPEVLQRVLRVHMRNAIGEPLTQQLALEPADASVAPSGIFIGSGVVIACGTVLGLLGVIQSSVATVLGGVVTGLVGAVGMVWFRRNNRAGAAIDATVIPLFDTPTLESFDRLLDQAATHLGDAALERLTAIKATVVRIAQHVQGVDEHFTHDDRMYLRECLRRYVPDTLEAFLRVPLAQRQSPLLNGQTSPEATMLRQLSMLLEELVQREKKIGRSAAEGLMKQDRFLASKRSR